MFVSGYISRFRSTNWLIPLHLPSSRIAEAAQPSIQKLAYNFKQWARKMSNIDPTSLPCCCSQLLRSHPDLQLVDGHVACSASLLSVSKEITPCFKFSSKSTVFADWGTFQRLYYKRISAWFSAQGFPQAVFQEFWNQVLVQEWQLHERALREDPSLLQQKTFHKVLMSLQRSLVFHLADHQATHSMVFCPRFYFQSVLKVWQDPTNFVQVHQSTERCKIQIHGSIPGIIRRKYASGIRANAGYRKVLCS